MEIKKKSVWDKLATIGTLCLVLIAFMGLWHSYFSMKSANELSKSLIERTAPNQPEIVISLGTDKKISFEWDLHSVERRRNNTYGIHYESFQTYFTNIGKGTIPWASIDLKDSKNEFRIVNNYDYYSERDISPFESRSNEWKFYHKNCTLIKSNDEEFNKLQRQNCNNINVSEGIRELVLRIRCPVCFNSEKYYVFYYCIYGKEYLENDCSTELPDWNKIIKEMTIDDKQFEEYQKLF